MLKSMSVRATLVAIAWAVSFSAQALADTARQIEIPAGDLRQGLLQLSKEYGVELVYEPELVKHFRTSGVRGTYIAPDAVRLLLKGTPLELRTDPSGAMLIAPPRASATSTNAQQTEGNNAAKEGKKDSSGDFRVAQVDQANAGPQAVDESGDHNSEKKEKEEGIPEILVQGSKTMNMDIRRSRDDVQPYVIFDRKTIADSGAVTLNDFLKQRLTMNSAVGALQQGPTFNGSMSQVNLRGLGTNQTLILIDGHRAVGAEVIASGSQQPDINGIPLEAIERIEVLPTTASGIYGGSATGGAINIILRRDYSGVTAKLTYDNSFDGGADIKRFDLNSGFSLEGGKTNVLLAASASDAGWLLLQDRNAFQQGRALVLANNPGFFLAAPTPPSGATPNIHSLTGENLVLKNNTPLNSPITFVPVGYGGIATDSGNALVANAGQYNFDFPASAQGNGALSPSLVGTLVRSVSASIRREFSSRIDAFIDAGASNSLTRAPANNASGLYFIPSSSDANPFKQDIFAQLPLAVYDGMQRVTNDNRRVVGGVIFKLTDNWRGETDYTWNTSDVRYSSPGGAPPGLSAALTATNGAPDVLRDLSQFPLDTTTFPGLPPFHSTSFLTTFRDATARVSGPVATLPGGPLTLDGLVEYNKSTFSGGQYFLSTGLTFVIPEKTQTVRSAYLEAKVPLIGAYNAITGVKALELQVAGRTDRYATDGVSNLVFFPLPVTRTRNEETSTNPTLGLRYQPVNILALRASYGTGFLPPAASQLVQGSTFNFPFVDPTRNNAPGLAQFKTGGNPGLRPEHSESVSLGAVYAPAFLANSRLSLDYTQIRKSDEIKSLGMQQIIDNEALFPGRVTRDANGIITAVDGTSLNVSHSKVEAYDLAVDSHRDIAGWGSFDFFATATWTPHYLTQLLPTTPTIENAGISFLNPLKFKGNVGITWNLNHWRVGWAMRYFSSYLVTDPTSPSNAVFMQNQGSTSVASQTYHDIVVTYSLPQKGKASTIANLLSNTEIQLGVRNVFNTKPPFDVTGTQYWSVLGDARLASYYLSVKKGF